MNRPDKIYLCEDEIGNISSIWHRNPIVDADDIGITYIRKGAIIEWLECLKEKADSDESRIFFETTIQQLKKY